MKRLESNSGNSRGSRSAPGTKAEPPVQASPPTEPSLPPVWEYTDYRLWLNDTFNARKTLHTWYSYGVLAQRSGFRSRGFLLRVMRGERGLSSEGAERLATALDLKQREKEYFLALVDYNQAKRDDERELAWAKAQHALVRARNVSAPRLLTSAHRQVMSSWSHMAVRSLIEMKPDPGDWEALGNRLRPRRSRASVQRSIQLLQKVGLLERRPDGLWHATDKSIATPPEVASPAIRKYHRGCLKLASASLERFPQKHRNVTGLMLGISAESYALVCSRIADFHMELLRIAEADCKADSIYHLTLALFPMSDVDRRGDEA